MPAVVVVCEPHPQIVPSFRIVVALRSYERGEPAVVLKLRMSVRLLESNLLRHELGKENAYSPCQVLACGAP